MTKYIFHGRVLPERANISLFHNTIELEKPHKAQITVRCALSKIIIEYEDDNQNEDLQTLKNLIEHIVRILVDSFGYTIACAYNIEIESAYNILTKEQRIFGVQEEIFDSQEDLELIRKGLSPSILERGNQMINIQVIADIVRIDPALQLALAEFRESIKRPNYTAAHCFNAIEALGQSKLFADGKGQKRKKLQSKLKITKVAIDKICKYGGNYQRHFLFDNPDWAASITWEKRKEQMGTTWEIIRRYIMLHKYPDQLGKLGEL